MDSNNVETFAFQAEINQLMSLIINTFYSNKEIFLRELISNSSDAIDKIRHQSLSDNTVLNTNKDLFIKIIPDNENKTLTIIDSGIGMTKSDMITNLGTIAQSGTKSFMEAMKLGGDVNMIGQFGVGFYSAYLVADKVKVISKHNDDDDEYCWESCAGGTFTITKNEDKNELLGRGTKIICYLKDDQYEYLQENCLRELIKKHSEFINYPIKLYVEKTREKEVIDEDKEDDDDEKKDLDEPVIEDVEEDDEENKKKNTKMITEKYNDFEIINTQKPIWTRKPDEITHDEYTSFYKSLSNGYEFNDHLAVKHFSVEGQLEFTCMVFVPKTAPFNLFQSDNQNNNKNIKLYVRRVFITDNCKEFIPDWLNFVKGIVDSEDLPLNISRETLQQNKILKIIKKNIIKKCIELFNELKEDSEKYETFYRHFSTNLKIGIHDDGLNREKLVELLMFKSSKSNDEYISLKKYVENMKTNQNNIYYIAGETEKIVKNSPLIEKCKSKDYEVLFFTDPLDEYWTQHINEYDGKKLINLSKEEVNFEETEDEKEKWEITKKNYEPLTQYIKSILEDKLEKVLVSNRITESPCILVAAQHGFSANMERIIKAQACRSNTYMSPNENKKIMEINPNHIIINELKERYDKNKNDNTIKDLIFLMYESSLISSGFTLSDPCKFVNRINNIIKLGLNLDDNEEDEEVSLSDIKSTKEISKDENDLQNESTMEEID